jgi:hypothetical protein
MIARFTRKDFLEALFGDYYKEHRGFILVKSFKRGDPKMSTRYFPNVEILAKEYYGEERDVFFGVAPRERMKAEREHIHYLVALWANLDIGKEGHEEKENFFESPQHAAKAIRSFPKTPSIIVESGRGAHLYWLLKNVIEVSDPDKIEELLKNISKYLKCDSEISIDAALRLPETVNTKLPSQLVNCDVKFINTNFRYTLSDFENLGEPVAAAPPPPKPAAAAPPPPPRPASKPAKPAASRPSQPRPEQPNPALSSVVGPTTGTDSLVLDETIIDELIDDISMAGTSVNEAPTSSETHSAPAPRQEEYMDDGETFIDSGEFDDYEEEPVFTDEEEPMTDSSPSYSSSPPKAAPDPKPSTPPLAQSTHVSGTSRYLQRLSEAKADVEISLVGSNLLINGALIWNENGLIGVESSGQVYTIPLSSVSFIKSNVR